MDIRNELWMVQVLSKCSKRVTPQACTTRNPVKKVTALKRSLPCRDLWLVLVLQVFQHKLQSSHVDRRVIMKLCAGGGMQGGRRVVERREGARRKGAGSQGKVGGRGRKGGGRERCMDGRIILRSKENNSVMKSS